MIQLSGLQVNRDIDIVFTGMRPGERLNEILLTSQEPTIEIRNSGNHGGKAEPTVNGNHPRADGGA